MFLLVLNLVLLVVGCVMDIFSAIVVVAPLLAPVGLAFGVHPVHLGVIFLANLELGYITPPVGMNLFLSSMRFKKPLGQVYRSTLRFFVLRVLAVLLITYIPWLTTWGADMFARKPVPATTPAVAHPVVNDPALAPLPPLTDDDVTAVTAQPLDAVPDGDSAPSP